MLRFGTFKALQEAWDSRLWVVKVGPGPLRVVHKHVIFLLGLGVCHHERVGEPTAHFRVLRQDSLASENEVDLPDCSDDIPALSLQDPYTAWLTPWCLGGNGGMDFYSSPYIIPNNNPSNPFPHSLLGTRGLVHT